MRAAISETDRRRAIQLAYNERHGITAATIVKGISDIAEFLQAESKVPRGRTAPPACAARSEMPRNELERMVVELEEEMLAAADELRFEYAAQLRDELRELRRDLQEIRAEEGPRRVAERPPRSPQAAVRPVTSPRMRARGARPPGNRTQGLPDRPARLRPGRGGRPPARARRRRRRAAAHRGERGATTCRFASSAGSQVQSILEAAESAAADIERQAHRGRPPGPRSGRPRRRTHARRGDREGPRPRRGRRPGRRHAARARGGDGLRGARAGREPARRAPAGSQPTSPRSRANMARALRRRLGPGIDTAGQPYPAPPPAPAPGPTPQCRRMRSPSRRSSRRSSRARWTQPPPQPAQERRRAAAPARPPRHRRQRRCPERPRRRAPRWRSTWRSTASRAQTPSATSPRTSSCRTAEADRRGLRGDRRVGRGRDRGLGAGVEDLETLEIPPVEAAPKPARRRTSVRSRRMACRWPPATRYSSRARASTT